jgi:photosystem II stability/assembly factor-like uncharacterized protein
MKKIKIFVILLVLAFATNIFAQTWTQQTSPITDFIYSSSAVDTNVCWMCGGSPSVIRTTNGGTNWTNVTGEISSYTIGGLYSIFGVSDLEAWVGGGDGNLYHTTNAGVNWELATLPIPVTTFIDAIHFFNQNTGFVLGDPKNTTWCYYWTTDAGANWTSAGPSSIDSEVGWNNSYAALDTGHIWFGTSSAKIYKGVLRGGFTAAETPGTSNIFGVAFTNYKNGVAIVNTLRLVDPNQITSDGGNSWNAGTFMPYGTQFAIKSIPGYPYVWLGGMVDSNGSIYYSTDNGINFTLQSSLPSKSCVNALTFVNINCGWAGLASGDIYRYHNTISDINNNKTIIPEVYSLGQNYPNPFNPSTNISYQLPINSYVTIKVCDVLGREVATLVNSKQTTGSYTVEFNASNLASGIYFYRLVANSNGKDFIMTKKMMVIK